MWKSGGIKVDNGGEMKYQPVYNRLRRIEGQIRGIEGMIEKERPATEILVQLEAAKSSLGSSISVLVDEMIQKNAEGKVTLSESELKTLLRLIKKD